MKFIFFVLDLMKTNFCGCVPIPFHKAMWHDYATVFYCYNFSWINSLLGFFVGSVCFRSVYYHLRWKTAWCLHVSQCIGFLGFLLQITTYTQGYTDNTIPPRLGFEGIILSIKQKCLLNVLVVDHK